MSVVSCMQCHGTPHPYIDHIHDGSAFEQQLIKCEAELHERTLRAEALDQELSAFLFAVSHDLRAPLRSINGFSHAVLEDYGDRLDDVGNEYLHHVVAACTDMETLIEGLTRLARISRAEMQLSHLNLSDLVTSIAHDLHNGAPDRDVRFVIQANVAVNADPQLVRAILEHLLDNAWKFTRTHRTACIEFGADEDTSPPVYFVRDDGAGFDASRSDKLFGAFQRLHTVDEFEGIGIGLATVQRMVVRHGGRVWITGEQGRGATVYFTLKPNNASVNETPTQATLAPDR